MTQSPEDGYTPPPPQPRPVPVSLPSSPPRATYAILGVTVFIYLLQLLSQFVLNNYSISLGAKADEYIHVSRLLFGGDLLITLGAKANDAIRAGQLWRFFTPIVLHDTASRLPLHIGFNMYALYILGAGLERRYGQRRFLLLYILSGFAGSVFSFLFSIAYSVGASGAIFGLIGAEGVFLLQNRKLFGARFGRAINNIIFIVAFNLFLGLQPGIDNWGHIGGLMGGLIFAWFAGPHWEVQGISPNLQVVDQREPRDVIVGAAVVTIIFCTLAAIGMWFPFVQ